MIKRTDKLPVSAKKKEEIRPAFARENVDKSFPGGAKLSSRKRPADGKPDLGIVKLRPEIRYGFLQGMAVWRMIHGD